MDSIEKCGEAVRNFLQKTLKVQEVKVTKCLKTPEGWEVEAEVFEESSFIKSLGLPTRVKDRNFYDVTLNENLGVESYTRKGEGE